MRGQKLARGELQNNASSRSVSAREESKSGHRPWCSRERGECVEEMWMRVSGSKGSGAL
jgi:hypothetical protein